VQLAFTELRGEPLGDLRKLRGAATREPVSNTARVTSSSISMPGYSKTKLARSLDESATLVASMPSKT
jgi:hypothetical protein